MWVFFLLTEINYNIWIFSTEHKYEKHRSLCTLFKENKINYKHENCALLHGAE